MKSHRKHAPDPEGPQKGLPSGKRHLYAKSKKQRIDELKQAFEDFMRELDRGEDEKGREQRCSWRGSEHRLGPFVCAHALFKSSYYRDKYDRLYAAARKDGII